MVGDMDLLRIYVDLMKSPVFGYERLMKYVKSRSQAYNLARSLEKNDRMTAVRSGLFVLNDLETGEPMASAAQIACQIRKDSVLCRDSAISYYLGEEIATFNIASDKRFTEFTYKEFEFAHVAKDPNMGILSTKDGLRISDPEWTLLEAVQRMKAPADLERILQLLNSLESLDIEKIEHYLRVIDNRFLYQKIGYIIESNPHQISVFSDNQMDDLVSLCLESIGRSKRYLLKKSSDDVEYVKRWQLIVPVELD